MRLARDAPGLIAVAILGGCAASVPRGGLPLDAKSWDLKPSITTRAEVLAKLGEPAASYENGSIAAYRFIERRAGDNEVDRTPYYWPVANSSTGPFLDWRLPAEKPGDAAQPVAMTLIIHYGPDDRIAEMRGARTFDIPWAWGQDGR